MSTISPNGLYFCTSVYSAVIYANVNFINNAFTRSFCLALVVTVFGKQYRLYSFISVSYIRTQYYVAFILEYTCTKTGHICYVPLHRVYDDNSYLL